MRFGLMIALIFFGVVFMANGSKVRNYNAANIKQPTRPRTIRGYTPGYWPTALGVGFGKRDWPTALGAGFGKRDESSEISTSLGVEFDKRDRSPQFPSFLAAFDEKDKSSRMPSFGAGFGKRDRSSQFPSFGAGFGKRDRSSQFPSFGAGFGKRDESSEIPSLNRRDKILMSFLRNFPQSQSSEGILREMKENPVLVGKLREMMINDENGQTSIGEQFQPEGTIFVF